MRGLLSGLSLRMAALIALFAVLGVGTFVLASGITIAEPQKIGSGEADVSTPAGDVDSVRWVLAVGDPTTVDKVVIDWSNDVPLNSTLYMKLDGATWVTYSGGTGVGHYELSSDGPHASALMTVDIVDMPVTAIKEVDIVLVGP